MATPITAAAAAYEALKLVRGDVGVTVELGPLRRRHGRRRSCRACSRSRFLLRYLRTRSLDVFVAYRLVLAAIVLVVWLG